MNKKGKGLASVMGILLMCCVISVCTLTAWAAEEPSDPADEDPVVKGPEAVIAAGSDYQGGDYGRSYVRHKFKSIVKRIDKAGVEYDYCIMCGDYSDGLNTSEYRGNATSSVREIRKVFKAHSKNITNKKLFFIQGNHDSKNKLFLSNGIHYRKEFIIYAMNTKSANPFHQGSERKQSVVKKTAKKMEAAFEKLVRKNDPRPVIIATHVPLHFSSRTANGYGDNMYSRYLFRVLNKYGKKLDIIYLFGHNHSYNYDNYLGAGRIFQKAGQKILIPSFRSGRTSTSNYTVKTLNFTYMNAGYTGYISSSAADRKSTCSVIKIYKKKIKIVRYGQKGKVGIRAGGRHSSSLIPKKYNVKAKAGAKTIRRKNPTD